MENLSLMLRIDQRLEWLAGQTFMHFGVEIKKPKVDFNLRGLAAGQAKLYLNEMSLNPIFLVENPDQFIDETVGHEFCHFGTKRIHPKAAYNHGRQWQGLMRTLGVPVKIDHTYNTNTILGKTPKLLERSTGIRVPRAEVHSEMQLLQDYKNRVKGL